MRSQSSPLAQAGERGWELQKRGRRRGHKVEVSELDLEELQWDWEQ